MGRGDGGVIRVVPRIQDISTGIDITKIRQVQMDAAATTTALLQGQVDFTTGWAFTDALRVAKQKPIEPPMPGSARVVKRDAKSL